jgi:hypothetical protein
VAGDPDRAAYVFHGTTAEGDSGDMATFPATAEWHLYVATTFDGGRTWELRNATPDDPTQKGSICDKGTTCDNTPDDRNLLDFMDADVDGEGRILVGYADGCVDSCVSGGPNSFSKRGYLARQVSGRRMYARFDPPPPGDLPGSPALTATRNPLSAALTWTAPASGTSPITGYVVERSTGDAAFRDVATAAPTATKHEDTTAIDETAVYRYRVSAVNAFGEGSPSNTVAPSLPTESVCTPPGVTVSSEGTGESALAPTDLTVLTVGQPYVAGGALTLSFQLKPAGGGDVLPPDTVWFVSFRNAAGVVHAVRMVTDAAGAPRFESYKVAAGNNGARRGDFVEGTPRPALGSSGYAPATGVITIVVPGSDVGAAAGESLTALLALSSKRAGLEVPATDLTNPGFVGGSLPFDLMPDTGTGTGRVDTVAVGQCGPNRPPAAVLSASPIGHRRFLNVRFDASRSTDPDATSSDPQLRDTIVKYVFDFGDGTPPLATTNPIVEHQYPQGGTYGATLRVQDSRGLASGAEAVRQICEKCLKER